MKTKKRRINGLLSLLLMLTLVLSACGNNQSSANNNANETQETPADSESGFAEEAVAQTEETEGTDQTETADVSGRLKMTLNGTDVVYAEREKHAHLDFTIDDSDLENIQYPYEIGDIIYYPPGPTFAMYYDHDGREISAGMEVIARLDEEGVAALGSYEDEVKVAVELSN